METIYNILVVFVILVVVFAILGMIKMLWLDHFPNRETHPPYLKFRKGTTITCPECGKVIGVANRDIYSFDVVSSLHWDGIELHSTMKCQDDLTPYIRLDGTTKIHTPGGWISKSPEIANAT